MCECDLGVDDVISELCYGENGGVVLGWHAYLPDVEGCSTEVVCDCVCGQWCGIAVK